MDASGNLYGGDPGGGDYKHGSIFKLRRPMAVGHLQSPYQFTGGGDGGGLPCGVVLVDANGNLYGTTASGGGGYDGRYGTVWEITP